DAGEEPTGDGGSQLLSFGLANAVAEGQGAPQLDPAEKRLDGMEVGPHAPDGQVGIAGVNRLEKRTVRRRHLSAALLPAAQLRTACHLVLSRDPVQDVHE